MVGAEDPPEMGVQPSPFRAVGFRVATATVQVDEHRPKAIAASWGVVKRRSRSFELELLGGPNRRGRAPGLRFAGLKSPHGEDGEQTQERVLHEQKNRPSLPEVLTTGGFNATPPVPSFARTLPLYAGIKTG